MLEEDDSSTNNVRLPDPQVSTSSDSSKAAWAAQSGTANASSASETKINQNAALLQASLDVALQSRDQPLALLLKLAINGINDLLAPQFGDNAIEATTSQDNTPSGTAGRIVSLSTGFFDAFKQQHRGENASDVLTKFMATIRSGFEQGAKEAQGILQGMGVLGGDIVSNIDKTLALVQQGYADYEAPQRSSLSSTIGAKLSAEPPTISQVSTKRSTA
jgi:hypothetical protein